ncbi:hypothetical protein M758_UG070600 [Ceratodon purpureus]|nr:hypothetical protein M758_UG070600 [Ceratodon purpureus]
MSEIAICVEDSNINHLLVVISLVCRVTSLPFVSLASPVDSLSLRFFASAAVDFVVDSRFHNGFRADCCSWRFAEAIVGGGQRIRPMGFVIPSTSWTPPPVATLADIDRARAVCKS